MVSNSGKFINWHDGTERNILLLNLWVQHNCVPTWVYLVNIFNINFCFHESRITSRHSGTFYSKVTRLITERYSGQRLQLTSLLDLVLKLEMSGAITPHPISVTMVCTNTAVTSYLYDNVICKNQWKPIAAPLNQNAKWLYFQSQWWPIRV